MSKLYQKVNGSAVPLSGGVGVINNLTSTSEKDALSANMGKELNERSDYSTSERVVGRWIDGKPLYQKTFDIGYLPNNAAKNIADLTEYSIKYVVDYESFCYKEDDYALQRPIPCTAINPVNSIRIDVDPTGGSVPYLRITTGSDLSEYKGYATIKYTKTTD